ncbi:hypothetical protein TWF481_006199 [Arthrobotrys musiformis]|uniref:BTB domain-containing protein n=1 Tax=Arthrobotrys musiformis TaxID=47236 RepID=A0AAV9WG16_9PEZI
MADNSRNQNRRRGTAGPANATTPPTQQTTPVPPTLNLRSHPVEAASIPRVLPDSWSRVPSRTPSHSEADTGYSAGEESDAESSSQGPHTPRRLSTNANNIAIPETRSIDVRCFFTVECDLLVVVRSNASSVNVVRYAVSKEVLAISSQVLRPLIRELPDLRINVAGRRVNVLEVTGDSEAFRIIFSILHFNPASDIREISVRTFAQITVLAEKYQLQGALEAWNPIWLDNLEPRALERGNENWLYIANVLNRNSQVEALVARLGRDCYAMEDHIMRRKSSDGRHEESLETTLWPEVHRNQIGRLRVVRVIHLISSLRLLRSTLAYHCVERTPALSPNAQVCESTICQCLAYGSFLRSIAQIDLELASGLETNLELGKCSQRQPGEESLRDWEQSLQNWDQSLLRWQTSVLGWEGSVQQLEDALCRVTFDTLETVVPGHSCTLQAIRSGFLSSIVGSDTTDEAGIRRILGASIARHRGEVGNYTAVGLPQSARLVSLSD